MKMDRLLSTPMPTFEGKHPGSPFWSNVAYWVARRILAVQFRSSEVSGTENVPLDRGNMCCAWHTNGLVDPLQIVLNHPSNFVLGGRHDLVTRPLLSWWTRRLAVQPVVRKAELLRGGCSEEEATQINGRTLMMLATGISYGFGCVLFPEGTSHNDANMLRFRTGPFRTVLAAAAIAKANQQPIPALVPVGLHFRKRELFRTDSWVEYGSPLFVEDSSIPDDLVAAVSKEQWAEPPAEHVFELRDRLRLQLPLMTPNTSDWPEYHALHLIGHLDGIRSKQPLSSWKEEVLAARAFRELLQEKRTEQSIIENEELAPITHPVMAPARAAASILEEHRLDARDLNKSGTELRKMQPMSAGLKLARLPILLSFLPLFIYSFWPQVAVGRLLGDSTDEGQDARSSYHFLAAMFGSLMFWPLMVVGLVLAEGAWHSSLTDLIGFEWHTVYGSSDLKIFAARLTFALLLLPAFFLSGRATILLWDDWTDFTRALRRLRMDKTKRQNLRGSLTNLHSELDKFEV